MPGRRLRYWKPIQTGVEQDDDTADVRWLAACDTRDVLDEGVRLERPVSPHLAARLSHQPIHLSSLAELAAAQPPTDRWIVEGAGGVLVPLDDSMFVVDLIALFDLPVVIVARSSLGTINHTLLTLEALRTRSLDVAGVVMVGVPDAGNRKAIEELGRTRVVGELPCLEPLTPEALAVWTEANLDREGHLERYFE